MYKSEQYAYRATGDDCCEVVAVHKALEDANEGAVECFEECFGDYLDEYGGESEGIKGARAGEADENEINVAHAKKDEKGCIKISAVDGGDGDKFAVFVERRPFGRV